MIKNFKKLIIIILLYFPVISSAQSRYASFYWGEAPYQGLHYYSSPQEVCDARQIYIGWPTPLKFSIMEGTQPPGIAGYCIGTGILNQEVILDNVSLTTCKGGELYFPDAQKCFAVTNLSSIRFPGENPSNNGIHCPSCGRPINPGTGNMWHREVDGSANSFDDKLEIVRTYNSSPYNIDSASIRLFGSMWTSPYDASVQPSTPVDVDGNSGVCFRREDTGFIWCEPTPISSLSSTIPGAVSVLRGDGKKYIFNLVNGAWASTSNINDRLTASYSVDGTAIVAWSYTDASNDTIEQFDSNGRLLSIKLRAGPLYRLTYSSGLVNDSSTGRIPVDAPICSHVQTGTILPTGKLLCVTDSWGRELQFEYDSIGRVSKTIDPSMAETFYSYDGPSGGCPAGSADYLACAMSNLTQIVFPDGKSKIYEYNEASQINGGTVCIHAGTVADGFGSLPNNLTGMQDENGQRYLSWTYNCAGLATSTQLAGGVEKSVLTYGQAGSNGTMQTAVSFIQGNPTAPQTTTRQYNYQQILGVSMNLAIDQPCRECGSVALRSYDSNGNLAISTDWRGIQTNYNYDLKRNLETSRVESAGTAQAQTVTTAWHATYRLPLKIAEPLLLTSFYYDASGNLLTKTVQATSDASGAQGFGATVIGTPRKWTYTYNAVGQVLTATGPRTDISDVTRYVYDRMGNLITVTNAGGQVTTLSNYDANSRVGHIAAPNGVTTDLTYTPRGWLSSRVVTSGSVVETTAYAYDGVGQLVKVTLPDTSLIDYTYDDAHRLTAVSDSLGNSIHYTLDLVGNRVGEQVADSGGALAKQVSRVYDQLNRLQQQTGIIQ